MSQPIDGNTYFLMQVKAKTVMSLPTGSVVPGANVTSCEWRLLGQSYRETRTDNNEHQMWQIKGVEDNTPTAQFQYYYIINKSNGLYLDVQQNGAPSNYIGAAAQGWPQGMGGKTNQWRFEMIRPKSYWPMTYRILNREKTNLNLVIYDTAIGRDDVSIQLAKTDISIGNSERHWALIPTNGA